MIAEQLTHFKPFLFVVVTWCFTTIIGWGLDDYGALARVIKEFLGALAMLITLCYAIIKIFKDLLKWRHGKKEKETL